MMTSHCHQTNFQVRVTAQVNVDTLLTYHLGWKIISHYEFWIIFSTEWKRPPPPVDLSQLDTSNPEGLLQMSKKGKTLMMFVSVSGNPSRRETEEITGIWHQSLMNNHLVAERYVVSDERVIFMFKDGSRAWEAKDYLIQQERCKEVSIENKQYPGVGSKGSRDELWPSALKKSQSVLSTLSLPLLCLSIWAWRKEIEWRDDGTKGLIASNWHKSGL